VSSIERASANPIARGIGAAVSAAILFGATTPLVKHFGAGVGAFSTATLLYAGAAVGAGRAARAGGEPSLGRSEVGRLVLLAALGAALAPACLAWGLQHTGALAASLLLNLEMIFTVLLARALYREPGGPRMALAVALMVGGSVLLGVRSSPGGGSSALGLAAIVGAALAWALDSTLTRPLADFDPSAVVLGKAISGAVLSAALAVTLREPWPRWTGCLALATSGALGYGVSLRLYLRAQRTLGAARTGSLFAIGPFVGAALAYLLGDREGAGFVVASGLLFAIAVYLHVAEAHHHRHEHEPTEHEHAHRHDDGHHEHRHVPPVAGEHSHRHGHDRMEHEHPHGADLHHRHGHE
jgi:drug/metabolite transporter (DMT)-like permease